MSDETKRSEIKLINRETLNITGLEKVIGTNESKISIMVSGVMLGISGTDLHVEKLDVAGGFIDITGKINELKYTGAREKGNFLKRLTK